MSLTFFSTVSLYERAATKPAFSATIALLLSISAMPEERISAGSPIAPPETGLIPPSITLDSGKTCALVSFPSADTGSWLETFSILVWKLLAAPVLKLYCVLLTTFPVCGSIVTPGTLTFPPDIISSSVAYANLRNPSAAEAPLVPVVERLFNIVSISCLFLSNNSLICVAAEPDCCISDAAILNCSVI